LLDMLSVLDAGDYGFNFHHSISNHHWNI